MGTTTNYGWEYPDNGGDADTWGAIHTTMVQAIDASLKGVSNVAAKAAYTGDVKLSLRNASHTGWVKLSGGTIGNASSGATERANADTSDLFTFLWNGFSDAICPVYNSSGLKVDRGANAAADFAANRRLTLMDARGLFPRIWDDGALIDSGRALGTYQAGQMPAHNHTFTVGNDAPGSVAADGSGITGTGTTSTTGGTDNSSENRPPNFSFAMFVKL